MEPFPCRDRRDFLKTTAAAGGRRRVRPRRAPFAAGNETIKVGLIGCGGRGSGAVRDILEAEAKINGTNPKVEIVAVGDVFKDQAEDAVKAFANPKSKDYGSSPARSKVTPETTFGGLDAYQKVLDAGVDLVILATPPGFRPLHLEAAVKAGKHIFCEKPVAVDATGIRKCFGWSTSRRRRTSRSSPARSAGTRRATSRRSRRSRTARSATSSPPAAPGTAQGIWFRDRAAEGMTDAEYQMHNWYHFLWLCGDHIVEQHVHNLDVINWVMNDHPVKAVGMGGRAARQAPATRTRSGNIWDHFAVEYEYKNGVKMYSATAATSRATDDVSETVVGTKGTCTRATRYQINKRAGAASDDIDAYVQEHIDLLEQHPRRQAAERAEERDRIDVHRDPRPERVLRVQAR